MYLADHEEEYKLYQQGAAPLDELGESPRDRAYRHFLLWQYGALAREVRVLFDPDNLASRLFPRPRVLRQLIDRLNDEKPTDACAPGNEETVGWVYQFFNAEELERAFAEVRLSGKKFSKEDIPSVTQLFTPRPAVQFLVENSLGRLWLSMHPDSQLAPQMPYLVPPAADPPVAALKSVREIRSLDPACGTMHFGLVAFDLLVQMYREELANAGKEGWPAQPPVARDSEESRRRRGRVLFRERDLEGPPAPRRSDASFRRSLHKSAVHVQSQHEPGNVPVHEAGLQSQQG